MRLKVFSVAVTVLTVTTTLAVADAARLAAQQCTIRTGAPGNYFISNAPGLPHVIPGQGGTAAGAARVNDCLEDAYAMQYGAKRGAAVAAGVAPVSADAALAECKRIRNRRITGSVAAAVGFTLGVGDPYTAAALGGAAGVGITTRRERRRYGECVTAAYATPAKPDTAVQTGCSRKDGVMRLGNSLCVSP